MSQPEVYKYAHPHLWVCDECSVNCAETYEDFMVQHELWLSVCKKKEVLCVGCLEERLGRKLNKHDFLFVPINNYFAYVKSERLYDRLTREK